MKQITPQELKKMILFSCERIQKDKEQINKINVFPVPDQDTGTNLASTLQGIKDEIEDKSLDNLADLSQSILEGALNAAQGNTGIIYTGFLAGFLPVVEKSETADAKSLAEAFYQGWQRAVQSIQNPAEGTVLDLMEAVAETFKKEAENSQDIIQIFEKSIEAANTALEKTPERMEVLKTAGVVDSGGLGFLMILESYLDALEENPAMEKIERKEEPCKKAKRFVQVLSDRFEVVALLENPESSKTVKEKLKNKGSCLDVIEVGDKMKIHIHTDYPYDVRDIISEMGRVRNMRIEDMAKQVAGEESVEKISVGIMTEESADITEKIKNHYKIEILKSETKSKDVFEEMEKTGKILKVKESCPEEIKKSFEKQLENFKHILFISAGKNFSNGYENAISAKQMIKSQNQKRIHIFNSENASAGQALLVLKAVESIQEHRTIKEIKDILNKKIGYINTHIFVEDPKWLEENKKISKNLGGWMRKFRNLNFYLVLEIKNGSIKKMGITKAKDSVQGIFRHIEKESQKIRKQNKKIRAVIIYSNNLKEAEQLKKSLKELKVEVSFINQASLLTGACAGPKSLIVAWTPIKI